MRQQDKDYIARLHPKIRDAATRALTNAETALQGLAQPIITYSLRTWPEQQAIYDQGRTKPGDVVTNAKAGQSYHNYGLALDGALIIAGAATWDFAPGGKRVDLWHHVVTAFKAEGFSWGGDWKTFKDYPHFEMTFGRNWSQLSNLYLAKKFIPGTTYVDF